MSTQNVTDPDAGQAVPSLNNRGNNEFADILSGDTGKNSGHVTDATTTESTAETGTSDKPELTKATLSKAAVKDDGTQSSTAPTSTQAAAATIAPGLDKAVLEQVVAAAVAGASSAADARSTRAAAQQVKQDKKELTAAEFNAKYEIPEINESVMQRILDQDPKKGAEMLKSLMLRQMGSAVLMAKDMMDKQMGEMRAEMKPHLDTWQAHQKAQREEKLETQFYSSNADLVNEKPIVKEMQDAIFGRIASGQLKPFNTAEDALKAVADASRAVLARMGKQTSAGTVQQSQQQNRQGQGQTHTRQMTAASTAGQSGTGRAAGKSDEESIFGPDYV